MHGVFLLLHFFPISELRPLDDRSTHPPVFVASIPMIFLQSFAFQEASCPRKGMIIRWNVQMMTQEEKEEKEEKEEEGRGRKRQLL